MRRLEQRQGREECARCLGKGLLRVFLETGVRSVKGRLTGPGDVGQDQCG